MSLWEQNGQSWAGSITPSCPLRQPITVQDLVHLVCTRSLPYNKEQYCPLGSACFVPAKKNSPKSNQVHKSVLLQNIFHDSKKIFQNFSLWMELKNKKTFKCQRQWKQRNQKSWRVSRIQFATKTGKPKSKNHKATRRRGMPYNKSLIEQACLVKIAEYWPGSLFAFLSSSRSIKTKKEDLTNAQRSNNCLVNNTHI